MARTWLSLSPYGKAKGVDKELTAFLKAEYAEELKIISEYRDKNKGENREYIEASVSGVVRLCEKLFDQTAFLDQKGDQLDFRGFCMKNYTEELVLALARALNGARHDV